MTDRTIATHCGGDLVIGGGPSIERVMHGWVYGETGRRERPPYGFMLGHREALALSRALELRQTVEVRTFTGKVRVTHTEGLAHLWFYAWDEEHQPERVCRLYEGARQAAAEAIGEVIEDALPECDFCHGRKPEVWPVDQSPAPRRICDDCLGLANRRVAA